MGIPVDVSQTFRKGASKAPNMLREVFSKLETHIDGIDLTEYFIEDIGNIGVDDKIETNKFPIILGGDHQITINRVKQIKPQNVLILDAHPDCEDSDGHDGVSRRLAEAGFNVYLIGPRVFSKVEQEYLNTGKVKIITKDQVKDLKNVYLSIDFDILDPKLLPAVGNPEPDGLEFREVMDIVKEVAPNLVAVDFVEFTPVEKDNDIYLSIAGKLIYSIMAEVVKTHV